MCYVIGSIEVACKIEGITTFGTKWNIITSYTQPYVLRNRLIETGTSADRDEYGDTFRPGSLEREGDELSLEATTRRSRRRVEHRWFFL
ncbi:hypothetical protein J6590_076496 [Homalodisca vitripennis]|nr:hypothetical protein J6590_076496 [Homalodisca vitripennis]